MDEAVPLGPRRFDFGRLPADDYEELCYLVVAIEFPQAVRLANPDGGLDSGIPRADGAFSRCWQAKRFTGDISWKKCEESLDAAVSNWRIEHCTFCFAKNLTGSQHRSFHERLVGRHHGVTVDYWAHGNLESKLVTSEQGQRIANYFYENETLNTEALMTALEAGGRLQTGADAMRRLEAIADFFATDPYYEYVTHMRPLGQPAPTLNPSAVIAFERGDSRSIVRIEAIPRNPNALARLPEGALHLDAEQQAKLDRFLRVGGELRFDGVVFEMQNLPALFDTLDEPSGGPGTVILRSPRRPIPSWDARLVAETDRGHADVDVRLTQTEPPTNWDAALTGTYGGLTITVLARASDGRGEFRTQFSYSYSNEVGIRAQARALRFMEAVHGAGSLTIEDNAQLYPSVSESLSEREHDPYWRLVRTFIDSLIVIENWTKEKLDLPETIAEEDVRPVIDAAQVIESRSSSVNFDHVELLMPVEKYEEFSEPPHRVAVGYTLGIEVFGREVWIGELRGEVPDVELDAKRVTEGGQERVQVFVRPTTEDGRHPVFALYPAHTDFTLEPADGGE
jgi:hypothetical protein